MSYIQNSPVFTGNPQAPTPLTADSSTSISTTAFVKAQGYGTGTVTAIGVTIANGVSATSSGGATPNLTITLGAITPTTVNGLTHLALGTGFSLAGGTTSKTLTVSNTLTLAGTDSSTLNIGTGGTLGTAAFTAASAYEPALGNPGTSGWVLTSTTGGVRSWVAQSAGFVNPMTTAGDLLFENSTPAAARLAIGTAGYVLTVVSGLPAWSNAPTLTGTNFSAIPESAITNLTTDLSNRVLTSSVGVASGVASLDSGGHVPLAQLPTAIQGALQYQGVWNANTNSPSLASGVGTKGYYYKVSVAGTTLIDGCSTWSVGDMIVFDGSTWDKLDGDATVVTSVNGSVGAVTVAATNQTMYLGTTALTINAGTGTQLTLAGMTSIAATTFTGNLTGNASGSAASFTGNLTGDVTSTGMATTLAAATVTGKLLTGLTAGTDVTQIAATDTILAAFQKLEYQENVSLMYGISTKTTTYNPTVITDKFIRCDATAGAFTITLLAAPTLGQTMFFKKIDSSTNAITVNGNGKNIDGAASITLMQAQYNSFGLIYNGTTWDVI